LLVVHMHLGVLILLLTLWMFSLRPVGHKSALNFQANMRTFMAKVMHFILYALLLLIPLSAYVGTGFDFPLLGLVNLPGIQRFGLIHKLVEIHVQRLLIDFIQPFAYFHLFVGTKLLLPLLLTGHIAAGLMHVTKKFINEKVYNK
jgi:cytochrome b561